MTYKLIWRINKFLLSHNLYSGANHIPLFYCSCWCPFHCDQTTTTVETWTVKRCFWQRHNFWKLFEEIFCSAILMWLQWVWLTIINHKKVKEKLSSRFTELRWGDPQWGKIDNIANNIILIPSSMKNLTENRFKKFVFVYCKDTKLEIIYLKKLINHCVVNVMLCHGHDHKVELILYISPNLYCVKSYNSLSNIVISNQW